MPRIAIDSTELYVHAEGDGPPLVFLHGFPLDHTMWQAQLDHFATRCRLIAPDLRGFGQSDVTPGTVTMEQHADDLAQILVRLRVREPITLCGLSMGGYVAWQFWRRHRDQLGRLILCDTRAIADTDEGRATRLKTAEQVEREGPEVLARAMCEKLYSVATKVAQPELAGHTMRRIEATSPAGIGAALRGLAARPDVTSWLPQIDVPALLICGEHDAISPLPEMQGIAAQIPGAQFAPIRAAGHMSPQEQPDDVNRAIEEFLGL